MPFQQFEAGIPIVVPSPLSLESIDLRRAWSPAAVVLNRCLQGTAVASGYIPNDAVNIEQQELARIAGEAQVRWGEGGC
tara:strand:+ start:220 stop:456 length:237 start_codon:yes stop_codon:yes gene_type:complete